MTLSPDAQVESPNEPPSTSSNLSQVSSLYALLPSPIKSRIPRLPSLRRNSRLTSPPSTIPVRTSSIQLSKKPYVSDLPSDKPGNVADLYDHTQAARSAEFVTEQNSTSSGSRPESPMPTLTVSTSIVSSRPGTPSDEDVLPTQRVQSTHSSARRASQQLQLSYAYQEAQHPASQAIEAPGDQMAAILPALTLLTTAHYTSTSSPEMSRPLILDATMYLLRALPKDLTKREIENIRDVIPPRFLQAKGDGDTQETRPSQWNLRTFIATTLIQFFVILALLLPYCTRAFGTLYRIERRNRIAERLLALLLGLMTACEDRSVGFHEAAGKFSQSKVGHVVVETIIWGWDGIVLGVSDGVGQGMKILLDQAKAHIIDEG